MSPSPHAVKNCPRSVYFNVIKTKMNNTQCCAPVIKTMMYFTYLWDCKAGYLKSYLSFRKKAGFVLGSLSVRSLAYVHSLLVSWCLISKCYFIRLRSKGLLARFDCILIASCYSGPPRAILAPGAGVVRRPATYE